MLAMTLAAPHRADMMLHVRVGRHVPCQHRQFLLAAVAAEAGRIGHRGAAVLDYSEAMPDPGFYADTDHLNRDGVTAFFARHLRAVLVAQP